MTSAGGVVPQALTRSRHGAVVFIDISGMRRVNERHGVRVGDRLMRAIERSLRARLPFAVTARLAGDQFIVVAPGTLPGGQVERLVLRAVERSWVAGRRLRPIRTTARSGSAEWHDAPSRRAVVSSARSDFVTRSGRD